MTSYLRPPDVVVYLRAGVDTLLRRIAQRGRACEQNIDRGYLELLNHAYDEWAARSAPELRFVVVETDGLERVETHPAIVKLVAEAERGASLRDAFAPGRAPAGGAAT
jgi:deoxyadenosine/deoxycytidine kinase